MSSSPRLTKDSKCNIALQHKGMLEQLAGDR
jgi:hypothetical protein